MNAANYEAFWTGLAAADAGNIIFSSVSKGKNIQIVDVTFGPNYTGDVTFSDGTIITITQVTMDTAGNILMIYMTDGKETKQCECGYDSNGYLIQVGPTTVQNMQSLGIVTNIPTQSRTVTPDGTDFTVTAGTGYAALESVHIKGDDNLRSYNIIEGVTIYGCEGTAKVLTDLQIKIVTPTGDNMTIEPDPEYAALEKVIIEGDNDLIPENIKKGVTIYGVLGTYEG